MSYLLYCREMDLFLCSSLSAASCTVDWNTHWANRLIQRMDQRFADRQDQVKSIELRKKYAVAHKTTSSDTPWDY